MPWMDSPQSLPRGANSLPAQRWRPIAREQSRLTNCALRVWFWNMCFICARWVYAVRRTRLKHLAATKSHTHMPNWSATTCVFDVEPRFNRPRQSSFLVYICCEHTAPMLISPRNITPDYYSVNTIQCRHFRREPHRAIYRLKWISWELISVWTTTTTTKSKSEGDVTDTGSPAIDRRIQYAGILL